MSMTHYATVEANDHDPDQPLHLCRVTTIRGKKRTTLCGLDWHHVVRFLPWHRFTTFADRASCPLCAAVIGLKGGDA